MKYTWENLDTGDKVEISPGQQKVLNAAEETEIVITPAMLKIQTGVSQFIKLSFANGIEMQDGMNTLKLSLAGGLEISDGTQTTQLTLLQLLHNNGAGQTNSITEEQMVVNNGTSSTVIEGTGVTVFIGGGASSTLTAGQLYLDDGAGHTNSVTDEQMVINGDGDTAIYAVDALSMSGAAGTVNLSIADGLEAEQDGATLKAWPYGVDLATGGGETASLSASSGLDLADGAGATVNVETQSGKVITMRETAGCEDVSGVPTPKKSHVLRSASVTF